MFQKIKQQRAKDIGFLTKDQSQYMYVDVDYTIYSRNLWETLI